MGYAIELKLNENSARQVLELWENLAAESISSLMLDIGSWPHISLAVFGNIDSIVLRQMLSRFASETSPFSVILASFGAFPGDAGAVFLAPVVEVDPILWTTKWPKEMKLFVVRSPLPPSRKGRKEQKQPFLPPPIGQTNGTTRRESAQLRRAA